LALCNCVRIVLSDLYASGRRRSNGNTNGLLRRHFYEGTPQLAYDQIDLDTVADSLNGQL